MKSFKFKDEVESRQRHLNQPHTVNVVSVLGIARGLDSAGKISKDSTTVWVRQL